MKFKAIALLLFSIIGTAAIALFYVKPPYPWPLSVLAAYTLVHFWLLFRNLFTLRWSTTKAICSLILGFGWIYSSHRKALHTLHGMEWVDLIVSTLMIALSFYLCITTLEKPFKVPSKQPSRWWMVPFGVIPAAVFTGYFVSYFPGKMTYDSFWQWDMAHGVKPYTNWHPILHTWFIQATTYLGNTPVAYFVIQIVFVSLVISYASYVLYRWGMPIWIVFLINLIYALNPVNGFYVITMWKDIPFATCVLWLTALLAQIVYSRGEWLQKKQNLVLLGIVSFLVMCLRLNGVETAIAALILFIVCVKGTRKRMALVAIPVIIAYFVYNGPVLTALHVERSPLNQALAIPSQQIAATYKSHGHFTPQLAAYFGSILPAQNWAADYNPYTVDPIKHDPAYDTTVIQASFSRYLENWAKLLALNPITFVRAYLNQVAEIWQFQSPHIMQPYFDTAASPSDYPKSLILMIPQGATHLPFEQQIHAAYNAYVTELQMNFPGIHVPTYQQYHSRALLALHSVKPAGSPTKSPPAKPNTTGLRGFLDKVFLNINQNGKNYFIKGAIPLFLLLLGLVAACRRFGARGLALFGPPLFVLITIAIAMPATDFRYSFSFIFSVPFLLLSGRLAPTVDVAQREETLHEATE